MKRFLLPTKVWGAFLISLLMLGCEGGGGNEQAGSEASKSAEVANVVPLVQEQAAHTPVSTLPEEMKKDLMLFEGYEPTEPFPLSIRGVKFKLEELEFVNIKPINFNLDPEDIEIGPEGEKFLKGFWGDFQFIDPARPAQIKMGVNTFYAIPGTIHGTVLALVNGVLMVPGGVMLNETLLPSVNPEAAAAVVQFSQQSQAAQEDSENNNEARVATNAARESVTQVMNNQEIGGPSGSSEMVTVASRPAASEAYTKEKQSTHEAAATVSTPSSPTTNLRNIISSLVKSRHQESATPTPEDSEDFEPEPSPTPSPKPAATSTPTPSPTPSPKPVFNTASTISVGGHATCALDNNGTAFCWGHGGWYQLGHGGSVERSRAVPVTMPTAAPSFSRIFVSRTQTCALEKNNRPYCWGYNQSGQLGDGSAISRGVPVEVRLPSGVSAFSKIFVGDGVVCALDPNEQPYCWGYNFQGQLGNGSNTDSYVPSKVIMPNSVSSFSSMSVGSHHACALASGTGIPYCWGSNNLGQLGVGSETGSNVPVRVTMPNTVSSFSKIFVSTGSLSCALTSAGKAYCWGNNSGGQLGNREGGTGITSNVPVEVIMPNGVSSFSNMTLARSFVCALTSAGKAFCWGNGYLGQLGNGESGSISNVPVAVTMPSGSSFSTLAVSVNASIVCALDLNGKAFCWGRGTRGALGNGSNDNSAVPVAVTMPTGITSFSSIAISSESSDSDMGGFVCALANTKNVYCWGFNNQGQLGNGTMRSSAIPVQVIGE